MSKCKHPMIKWNENLQKILRESPTNKYFGICTACKKRFDGPKFNPLTVILEIEN